jgi:hypothetical protein
MNKIRLIAALAASLVTVAAAAAPVAVGSSAFTSSTLIDFNAVGNEAAVGSQYSADGVTFSGALVGMTNSGDVNLFPANGGVIASNWSYGAGHSLGQSFTATFSSLVSQVGFNLENWPNQVTTVELFNGATSLGVLTLANTPDFNGTFRGIADSTGFDSMVFTEGTQGNGFFAIDDLLFTPASAPIPEPANVVLLLAGLAALGLKFKGRKA